MKETKTRRWLVRGIFVTFVVGISSFIVHEKRESVSITTNIGKHILENKPLNGFKLSSLRPGECYPQTDIKKSFDDGYYMILKDGICRDLNNDIYHIRLSGCNREICLINAKLDAGVHIR